VAQMRVWDKETPLLAAIVRVRPARKDAASRRFARRSALTRTRTRHLQLGCMGRTEVPSELFRMKNVKQLFLSINKLCSLSSEVAQLPALEKLWVRPSKRSGAI
jgi:Leucine-rich repeat (LRR) protein